MPIRNPSLFCCETELLQNKKWNSLRRLWMVLNEGERIAQSKLVKCCQWSVQHAPVPPISYLPNKQGGRIEQFTRIYIEPTTETIAYLINDLRGNLRLKSSVFLCVLTHEPVLHVSGQDVTWLLLRVKNSTRAFHWPTTFTSRLHVIIIIRTYGALR